MSSEHLFQTKQYQMQLSKSLQFRRTSLLKQEIMFRKQETTPKRNLWMKKDCHLCTLKRVSSNIGQTNLVNFCPDGLSSWVFLLRLSSSFLRILSVGQLKRMNQILLRTSDRSLKNSVQLTSKWGRCFPSDQISLVNQQCLSLRNFRMG